MLYTFIIERPDGSTFEQMAPDILSILDVLGDDYWIVDIF